jgi:hypothetical protein
VQSRQEEVSQNILTRCRACNTVDLIGMLAAAHQEVPEQLHRLAQKDPRFRCHHDDDALSNCSIDSDVDQVHKVHSAEPDGVLHM